MAEKQGLSRLAEHLAKSAELKQNTRETGLDFLKTEIAMGLTFAEIARDAGAGSNKRIRNQANARKAYDTIMSWCSRQLDSQIPRIEEHELEPALTGLRSALKELGEAL